MFDDLLLRFSVPMRVSDSTWRSPVTLKVAEDADRWILLEMEPMAPLPALSVAVPAVMRLAGFPAFADTAPWMPTALVRSTVPQFWTFSVPMDCACLVSSLKARPVLSVSSVSVVVVPSSVMVKTSSGAVIW